ncbi:hypothetical protein [Glaciecola sp. 1036]|uniref:hypothetical protein n=1 Tax=Alteromonadaceae TaxID=72275 RepID=UPI003CFE960B
MFRISTLAATVVLTVCLLVASFSSNAVILEYTVEQGSSAGVIDYNMEIIGEASDGDNNEWFFEIWLPFSHQINMTNTSSSLTEYGTSDSLWFFELFDTLNLGGTIFPVTVSIYEDYSSIAGFSSTTSFSGLTFSVFDSSLSATNAPQLYLDIFDYNYDLVDSILGTNVTPTNSVASPSALFLMLLSAAFLASSRRFKR